MKYIVYKYSDNRSDELEFDRRGELTLTKDDIVSKQGTSWRIVSVEEEGAHDERRIPTVWVYLTREMVN